MSDSSSKGTKQKAKEAGQKAKEKINDKIKRARDRRRRTRQRLEEIWSRKNFMSFAVVGAMGKLVETVVIPSFIALRPVIKPVGMAWAGFLLISIWVSIKWERLAKAGENVADAVEEATD